MACRLSPDNCRHDDIAGHLEDAKPDGGDFEARCPICEHDTFRVSKARSRSYRNIWACACKTCGCTPSLLRAALLKLDIQPGCLGIYDGRTTRAIPPEIAKRQDLAIRDIFAVPGLRPADMRIILAEAAGWKIPGDLNGFVKFAMQIGVGRRQAYEAAERWIGRPSDCRPPQTGGQVVDTSRNTESEVVVKPSSSAPHDRAETAQRACGERTESPLPQRAETAQRKPAA